MDNFNVAYCGLYCGECGKFKKGKCPGCYANDKASWCEIRRCCKDNGYCTCADCEIMPLDECKKYNNFAAKVIGFVSRTDRSRCIISIKEQGVVDFADDMKRKGKMSFKK